MSHPPSYRWLKARQIFERSRFRHFFPRTLRLTLVLLMACTYVLTSSTITALPTTHATPSLPQTTQKSLLPARTLKPAISASTPFDGLGDLSFYTYVTLPLNDRLELKVNVANGNLLVHSRDLSIHGRGIDLNLDTYYNSQTSYNYYMYEHGSNWASNLCSTQYIDIHTNPSAGIPFFGPSNFSAFFALNSDGSYKDAPGLNATLKANSDGTYTLTYHQTGEKVIFGSDTSVEKIEDKNGNTISCSYAYGSLKTTQSLTDTEGRTVTFAHNSNNQMTQMTDSTGRTVNYSYDGSNNLSGITDQLNQQTSFGYSGHDLTSITDPLSHTTSISYLTGDKAGTITDATGNGTISFTYNNGNTVVKDQNGHSTTYTYNSNLQVTQTTDALGHSSTKKFDALNYNVTQQGDALSNFSNFVFSTDGRNNLSSVSDGTNATTTFGYPTSGTSNLYYPLSQTDPQSNTTNFAYDTNGNLLSATDQKSGNKLTYTYNSNGTAATGKDANNNQTSYGYDTNGNLTSVTQPSPLGKITLTVDALSRVTSVTGGQNQKTSYTYDNLDRVTTITYSDATTITYAYDANSNLTSTTDNTGTTSFTYDQLNRTTQKQLPDGTQIKTAFDKVGNLTSYNDSTGTVTYAYDAANRMTTLTDPDGSITTYGYDNANRKISIAYPNGTGQLMGYDGAGHETSVKGGVMSGGAITTTYDNYTYSYLKANTTSATSLLQSVTYLDPVGHTTTYKRAYTYDTQNRLTTALLTNANTAAQVNKFSYGYDANGNRTSSSVAASSTSITSHYNSANELTTSVNGSTTTTYTYDANGNLTGQTSGNSITYNNKNQTQQIGTTTYTYSGPTQTDRVQIGNDSFGYGTLGLTLHKVSGQGNTDFVRCSCGLLNDERTGNGQKYYYLFDGLGSIVGMTDSTGSEVNSYDYDPYGILLNSHAQSGINNPWMYADGYYDSNSGLYKYGIRYYDPATGRWTQRTPVGGSLQETLKANPYTYTDDNPVNEVDPSGQSSWWSDATSWWNNVSSCTNSAVGSFLQWAGGIAGGIGTIGALPAALAAGATAPAWTVWVGGTGAALFLGVSAFCVGWGSAQSILG